MTRICVAGGTGQVGGEVVRRALAGGHSVAALCRHPLPAGAPARVDDAEYFAADVTTGEGLAAALAGADVVIDCLEGRSGKDLKNFADGGARLLAAAQDADVSRAVMLSIVNCDRSSFGYYTSKAAKEQVYERSGLDTVVVRATQFHSLLAAMFGAARNCGSFRRSRVPGSSRSRPATSPLPCLRRRWNRPRTCGTASVPSAGPRSRTWRSSPGSGGPSPVPAAAWCGCRCRVPWETTCVPG
ncbi:NAD(P)H-binding protein [Arthrobacter sp. OVS8]|nr:NAD(P)H-binding protein [Arthrobacter sp. OVS8]